MAPSGEQFQITAGAHRAIIVEVGGGVREYAVADRDVHDPYPLDAMCDGAHGAPLMPWPNRPTDGAKARRTSPLDFAAGKHLGNQRLDYPLTDLARDDDRRAWVRLTAADGSRVEL